MHGKQVDKYEQYNMNKEYFLYLNTSVDGNTGYVHLDSVTIIPHDSTTKWYLNKIQIFNRHVHNQDSNITSQL